MRPADHNGYLPRLALHFIRQNLCNYHSFADESLFLYACKGTLCISMFLFAFWPESWVGWPVSILLFLETLVRLLSIYLFN